MKRKKITIGQIVLLFLWVLFLVLARYLETLPKYDQIVFIIKHISYFVVYSTAFGLVVTILYRVLKGRLSTSNFSLKYLNIFTLIFIIGGLVTISSLRIDYIERRETPTLAGCTYYDHYNNVIYETSLYGVCPELEVIENSDDTLKLHGNIRFEGGTYYYHASSEAIVDNEQTPVTVSEIVDIEITYEGENLMTYDQQLTKSFVIHGEVDFYEYYSYKISINNTYEDSHFHSTQEHNYEYNSHLYEPNIFYDHYVFSTPELIDEYDAIVTSENLTEKELTISGIGQNLSWNQETHKLYVRTYDFTNILVISQKREQQIEFWFESEDDEEKHKRTIDITENQALLTLSPFGDDSGSQLLYSYIDERMLIQEHILDFGVSSNEYVYNYYHSSYSNELMASSSFNGYQFYKISDISYGTKIEYYYDNISFGSGNRDDFVINNQQFGESSNLPKLNYLNYYDMIYGHVTYLNTRLILENNALLIPNEDSN